MFSRECAVLLQNKTDEVKPELKITKAKATQVNNRNMGTATVDNERATYGEAVSIEGEAAND